MITHLKLHFYILVLILARMGFGGDLIPVETSRFSKAPPLKRQAAQYPPISKGRFGPTQELNSICFDSSRNGFGWHISTTKPIDYSYTQDAIGAVCRRFEPLNPNTGLGGWVSYWLHDPFQLPSLLVDELTPGITFPLIVRNPILLATDSMAVAVVTHYNMGSGSLFLVLNSWIGWNPMTHLIQISLPWPSFWNYSADVVKTNSGEYRIGLIGEIEENTGNYGFVLLSSPDQLQWNLLHTIELPDSVEGNTPRFAWGSNGFGAWMSNGHYASQPDSDYLPIFSFTSDYGYTWTNPQRIGWQKLGMPDSIAASDSIFVPDPNTPGDSVLYNGPAFVGIAYDFDFLIQPNNKMHLGATVAWGPFADSAGTSFYPHPKWSGLYDISSGDQGLNWNANRIWINSGLNPGDSSGHFVFTNEIDLGQDEQGGIYAAWVDRDPQNIVQSPFPRVNGTDYNLDVWACRSPDGGQTWSSQPVRVTDNQQVCHYGLHLSPRSKYDPANNGRIMLVYQIADLTRPYAYPSILADHVQWLYMAEAKNFPPPVGIEKPDKPEVANSFRLFQNYPNPFNSETAISFQLSASSFVEINIYNLLGQKVKSLANRQMATGGHTVKWDGRDDAGRDVASGIYICQLRSIPPSKGGRGDVLSRKMLILR